jgi:D-alanyl-D-alanine carboxypeptidase (penicillin-binding protein 5/6)
MRTYMKPVQRITAVILTVTALFSNVLTVKAEPEITSPSVVLIEASTGTIIYEKNFTERRSPASITKIMTLLIAFEQIESGRIHMSDTVTVSQYASSMGGSQVFLAEGETQTLETLIKCITVASGNDASVAVAEYIAGSESEFVDMMNKKAEELGMGGTHFVDCCGLSDSDDHYTCARDVAIMSRELTTKYPDVFKYTQIWSEDITHVTSNGTSIFTLNSTNKLLKQYPYTTGLKTGSTSKALYCLSATASKDGIDLIAVVMGAPDNNTRFGEAKTLLNYGFNICRLYTDDAADIPETLPLKGGIEDNVGIEAASTFRYIDIEGNNMDNVEKVVELPEYADAPVNAGDEAGVIKYMLDGRELGSVSVIYSENAAKAYYMDYLKKAAGFFLL